MRQKENLRTRLFELLLALPEMQMGTSDRQAFFLVQIGLERQLHAQINWEGSQQAVVNDLLMRVVSEGREQLLRFCQKFDNDRIGGLDQQIAMHRLIFAIGQLSEQEWEQEFSISNHYASLGEGALALERKDYRQALSLLKKAVQEITSTDRRLAAKARYLQALALLGGSLPHDTGLVTREKVEELMNAAIELDRCRAYLLTLVFIKRDIYMVTFSSQLREEVYKWQKQANSLPNTTYDDELLVYLKCCQPGLYNQT